MIKASSMSPHEGTPTPKKNSDSLLERKTVSLQETASMLGVSLFTVRKLVKTKKLKTIRFTERGQHLVTLTEINRLLEESK